MTVNAAATFAASTTFANTLLINSGATVTGDIVLNSHLDMVDEKAVKFGTDDDLLIYYSDSQGASMINSTSQLALNADTIKLYNLTNGNKYIDANTTNTIVYHNN